MLRENSFKYIQFCFFIFISINKPVIFSVNWSTINEELNLGTAVILSEFLINNNTPNQICLNKFIQVLKLYNDRDVKLIKKKLIGKIHFVGLRVCANFPLWVLKTDPTN